jgi:hypothetical protein
MKQTLLSAAALAALAALSACGPPETVTGGPVDPQAEALKNAPPVEAPAMIQQSRTYRCKDNSLVYIDFYTNNTARARTEKDGTPTVLTAPEGTPPYTAQGWSVSGSDAQVTLTAPGKGTQSCKA